MDIAVRVVELQEIPGSEGVGLIEGLFQGGRSDGAGQQEANSQGPDDVLSGVQVHPYGPPRLVGKLRAWVRAISIRKISGSGT
jgi:hypothetical protein